MQLPYSIKNSGRTLQIYYVVATFIALLSCAACSGVSDVKEGSEDLRGHTATPNIVFIVSDDHSARHYGYLDAENFKTPNLNRLAEEGTVFTRAYVSVPQCAPSRASLMTGQSALAINATRFSAPLSREFQTFPEVLRNHGYFTGVIGRSHHLDGSLDQGANADIVFDEFSLRATADRFDVVRVGYGTENQGHWIKDWLSDFLEAKPSDEPFFLQYNFVDPHRPWSASNHAPKPDEVVLPIDMPDRPSVREDFSRYVGEIERMDSQIGDIIDLLTAKGVLQNTLIVFMGDNGAAILRGKGTLNENGINVPLIAWMPETVPSGQIIDELVSGEDIAPTFIDFSGAQNNIEMTGVSFADILHGKSNTTNREFVFATRGAHGIGLPTTTTMFDINRAIVSQDSKLIYNVLWQIPYNPADANGSEMWLDLKDAYEKGELAETYSNLLFASPRPMFELYDLKSDPYEMNNLIRDPAYSEIKENLRSELERWMILNNDYVPLPYLPKWQAEYEKGVGTRTLGYAPISE